MVMKLSTIIALAILLAGCLATTKIIHVDRYAATAQNEKRESQSQQRRARPPPNMQSDEPRGGSGAVPQPSHQLIKTDQSTVTDSVSQVTKQLFSASLAFVIPTTANIDDVIKAQLLINPIKVADELVKDLSKKGTVTQDSVRVSRIVKAAIVAPEFDVVAITEAEQALAETESTEWLWALTAKSAGAHDVTLSVTALITVDGRQTKHHLKTFEKVITIDVTPNQIVLSWLEHHWQWLISTLLIPFGVWLYRKKFQSQ